MLFDIFNSDVSLSALHWLGAFALVFFGLVSNYLSIAGLSYWYFWKRSASDAIRIQEKDIAPGQIRHEITWSFVSMLLFSLMTLALVWGWRQGFFPKIYFNPMERGFWGLIAGSLVFMGLQDLLFYLTHRLLHHKRFLRYHRTHHVSRIPTPFALYAFHPVEATLHFLRLPLMLSIFPVNIFVLVFAEGVVSNMLNAYSHLNHEPRWIRHLRPIHSRMAAASCFHSLHHLRGHGNYGGYLRFWDQLFKTQLPESERSDAKVHAA